MEARQRARRSHTVLSIVNGGRLLYTHTHTHTHIATSHQHRGSDSKDAAAAAALVVATGFRSNGGSASVLTAPPSVVLSPPVTAQPAQQVKKITHKHTDDVKVPLTINDVDNGRTVGFGADLADDHPVRLAW